MHADLLISDPSSALAEEYADYLAYAQEKKQVGYAQFDADTLTKINLFTMRDNFDFAALEETIDRITMTLGAIRHIFAHPITRLKDIGQVLPVEAVHVVNNHTIVHASSHSELWSNVTADGMQPRKLMTLQHEDDYAIYENIAFARAVDLILGFVSKQVHILRDILYVNRDMKFNLLDREVHMAYFLALGKLHFGYVNDYDQYRVAAERCLNKLLYIDHIIRARLNSAVYQHCRHQMKNLALKKTNIFRMHKDYHRIWQLLKWFSEQEMDHPADEKPKKPGTDWGYLTYCLLLTLFAAGHFNFVFDENTRLDFSHPEIAGRFGKWHLLIETLYVGEICGIRLVFYKDAIYRVMLIPSLGESEGTEALASIRESGMAEEYLLALPFSSDSTQPELSRYDPDSFRRIQQILLRGMIACDRKRQDCPFCGQALISRSDGERGLECRSCRTQIVDCHCPQTERDYTVTTIRDFVAHSDPVSIAQHEEERLRRKRQEACMQFRNITALNETYEPLCPHCGSIHTNQI